MPATFHADNASLFASLGIPTFACTPDHFPSLMVAAIQRPKMNAWAAPMSFDVSESGDSFDLYVSNRAVVPSMLRGLGAPAAVVMNTSPRGTPEQPT